MNEYGEATGKDTVRIERLLPGPIERVWAYLTESEKRSKWLAAGDMEVRVGGKVQLRFMHSNLSPVVETTPERFQQMDCGVGFDGTVTECEPPRLLAYTWGGDTSEVRFELSPQADKVLLVITHTRLADRDEMTNVSAGWHAHLGILEDNLVGQTPRPFWATWLQLEQEYKRRLAE
ncbi:SRPBCC family protein [Blastopirellula marina]|uniref:ATPase n=1 Tax=Blastopirellula marina TaxID=124 RepID=A0A2S8GTA9_9BACT|nr:SRPBCC family protein [Blastopirellula marina]PQO47659.1 ATPase [Blastopirellula marina]